MYFLIFPKIKHLISLEKQTLKVSGFDVDVFVYIPIIPLKL